MSSMTENKQQIVQMQHTTTTQSEKISKKPIEISSFEEIVE